MTVEVWTTVLVIISFIVYVYIGWHSRVNDTKGFFVAEQGVPAVANGAATAADWMSAASFISMAGLISFLGYDGSIYLMGWTGGYVLLALLLAPYLRKFGKYTVPDFVGDRYYSNVARLVAVVAAIFVSMTYVAGQMRGVGIVFSRFLQVDVSTGVVIGMVSGVLRHFRGNEGHHLDPSGAILRADCGLPDSRLCHFDATHGHLCAATRLHVWRHH
jgi:cation/acetate symporter